VEAKGSAHTIVAHDVNATVNQCFVFMNSFNNKKLPSAAFLRRFPGGETNFAAWATLAIATPAVVTDA
jgi:hypothetical protein